MARIFIVCGQNQDLAYCVAKKLQAENHDVTVCAGDNEIYNMSNRNYAVILATYNEKTQFDSRLMLEWGYALSAADGKNEYIIEYLIDTERNKLPADLQGIWIGEYGRGEDDVNNIADQIINKIKANPTVINKMEIMSKWGNTKAYLRGINDVERIDNDELFGYIFFSEFAAYYHCECKWAKELLSEIKDEKTDTYIKAAIKILTKYYELIESTNYLLNPLINNPFDISRTFGQYHDFCKDNGDDSDKGKWIEIKSYDLQCLAQLKWAQGLKSNDQLAAIEKYKEAIGSGKKTIELIETYFPEPESEDRNYAMILKAYTYRNMSVAYSDIAELSGQYDDEINKNIEDCLIKSDETRSDFYAKYNERYHYDMFLKDKFEQEWYLARIELAMYKTGEDRDETIRGVEEYISRYKKDDRRRTGIIDTIKRTNKNVVKIHGTGRRRR